MRIDVSVLPMHGPSISPGGVSFCLILSEKHWVFMLPHLCMTQCEPEAACVYLHAGAAMLPVLLYCQCFYVADAYTSLDVCQTANHSECHALEYPNHSECHALEYPKRIYTVNFMCMQHKSAAKTP